MSLKSEIEEALVNALSVEPDNKGNLPQLAEDLTKAIVKFIQQQTFTITEMESILRVEEIKTTGTLEADVLNKVKTRGEGRGTGNQGMPVTTQVRSEVSNGRKGVKIPKLDLRLSNGQGGSLTAIGHSYIGQNPVDSTERNSTHGDNKVKLLEVVGDE